MKISSALSVACLIAVLCLIYISIVLSSTSKYKCKYEVYQAGKLIATVEEDVYTCYTHSDEGSFYNVISKEEIKK